MTNEVATYSVHLWHENRNLSKKWTIAVWLASRRYASNSHFFDVTIWILINNQSVNLFYHVIPSKEISQVFDHRLGNDASDDLIGQTPVEHAPALHANALAITHQEHPNPQHDQAIDGNSLADDCMAFRIWAFDCE